MSRTDVAYFPNPGSAQTCAEGINSLITSVALEQQVAVWDTGYGRYVVAIYQAEAPGSNAVWKGPVHNKV